MIPTATYRLQFHKGFGFADAAALADYFRKLGVSHIYASPILKARAGSRHGYDTVDFSAVNPELGGEDGFRRMARTLREHEIGIFLDIVPNHMAVGKHDNAWWLDVLANGQASPYSDYFDIDWMRLNGKLLAPFLDGSPAACLEAGTLRLASDTPNNISAFVYFDHLFPLRPEDSALVQRGGEGLAHADLLALLERQHYVLEDWRKANARINWRRFFDITELAGLRVERDKVFDAVHAKILSLCAEDLIDGLRVDHIDGLSDPGAYCRKLRHALAKCASERPSRDRPYLIVEKILAHDEALAAEWPIDGTTGYDFMADVCALLHAPDRENVLQELLGEISGRTASFEIEELDARSEVLGRSLSGQFEALAESFTRAARSLNRELASEAAREVLEQILLRMRAYRTYATGRADTPGPGPYFTAACATVLDTKPHLSPALDLAQRITADASDTPEFVEAIRRFNQLSAPLAAKAVEDTAFDRYGRLLSLNEVGSDPRLHSLPVHDFHARISARTLRFPHDMVTTATHDHKRGEDARARLAVLSECPRLWGETVREWLQRFRQTDGVAKADAYFLFQSLLGAWPVPKLKANDISEFSSRIATWCRKHLREAKLRSSWELPDIDYEAEFEKAARALIADEAFRKDMEKLLDFVSPAALANSIVQTVLRCTVAGVPDLYQGNEGWDFSLVDPDNRRPVDFGFRAQVQQSRSPLVSNPEAWVSGGLKQKLVTRLLTARREHAAVFLSGDYQPIKVVGPRADHVVAFERRAGDVGVFVVGALRCAEILCGKTELVPPVNWWGDTELLTPEIVSPHRDALTDAEFSVRPKLVGEILDTLPASVLFFTGSNHS